MDLIANRSMTYATRRLLPGDSFVAPDRVARVLIAAKKATMAPPQTSETRQHDQIAKLRSDYHHLLGKKPYHGWDEATLRAKIASAKG